MENDQRIENFQNIKEIPLKQNKDDILMDPTNSKTNSQAPQVSLSGSKGISNTNSPKMGSRRIFTPQFKLQVLESYRNDHDCKGNQRATARKYNIHRRQIQKWLQCESSLRSSVANINQNSVKHQFHNVSMQQQQTKNVLIASESSLNGLSYAPSQLHSAQFYRDSSKVSTSHKTIDMPSISSCVGISPPQETEDIINTNLVSVPIARASTSSTSSPTVQSPLRPSAIITANGSTNTSMSPLLHHHYGIPTYANVSATATVPILVHHINSSQQTPYQYHNMPYNPPTLSHHQTDKQRTSYFTPTLFLPAADTISNGYTGGNNEHLDKLDLPPLRTKVYPKILSEQSFLCNTNQFPLNYICPGANRVTNSTNTFESFAINQFNGESSYSTSFAIGPMDLSLRHGRDTKSELVANTKANLQINKVPIKKEISDSGLGVVDLTHRKRKASNTANSSNTYKHEHQEKQLKSGVDAVENKFLAYNLSEVCSNHHTGNSTNSNDDDDIEIEVGTEEKFYPASKPVKLFKPYLLGECETNVDSHISCNTNGLCKNEKSQEMEQILKQGDAPLIENTFPATLKTNSEICADNNNFPLESRSESPRSACSPATYIPTMSPTSFQYCKSSPASSGYESSTSTYSDTSLSSRSDPLAYGQTYSVNLQMQTLYNANINISNPSNYVQRWLEKANSNSLETNPTIALLV